MQLTTHFTLEEMCATTHVIPNTLDPTDVCDSIIIEHLSRLCKQLERLRTELGEPVYINSGYRSPTLNKAVGGAKHSLHQTGCAADISCSGVDDACRKMAILARTCPGFTELIIERRIKQSVVWLHFGYDINWPRGYVAYREA